jgi:hypothetical protein
MQLRRGKQVLILDIPDFLVGPAGDICDTLAEPPVGVPLT